MAIARTLLRWYDGAKRDLPWRHAPTPYETLVSELMLQQTTVAAVVPYFRRFVARFPDLAALARATDEEVTALWSGLGYYARARNLRRAAEIAVREHAGELPSSEEELRRLPGLGPYTAAAVAAIAFGRRAFALDGNAGRVLARLFDERRPIDAREVRAALHARALAEVPRARPGDFNQAVMELGATVCTPRAPRCDVCPVARACAARAQGSAQSLPRKRARIARPAVRVVCACITDGANVLVVRRAHGLLGGTWSLPEAAVDGSRAGDAVVSHVARTAAAPLARIDERAPVIYSGDVRHLFTHRDVTAAVYRIAARACRQRRTAAAAGDRRWVAVDDLVALGVSSYARKTIDRGLGI